jgi:hypothetical protein
MDPQHWYKRYGTDLKYGGLKNQYKIILQNTEKQDRIMQQNVFINHNQMR